MAVQIISRTVGTTGTFSTPQLWEDGAPGNLTTAEKSAAGTFAVAGFATGETITFVGSGATGKFLDTDSTGPGTGTYITYGLISGNPAASDVATGGVNGGTCVLSSSTPTDVGVIWEARQQDQEFSGAGTQLTINGSTSSSTCFKHYRTLAGASFRDHASIQTNALRYNASNGAAITGTSGSGQTIIATENYCQISDLQIAATGSGGRCVNAAQADGAIFTGLICEGKSTSASTDVGVIEALDTQDWINCLIILRATGADHVVATHLSSPSFYSCTIAATDDLATAPVSIFTSSTSGTVTCQSSGLFAGDSTKAVKAGSATFNFTTSYSDISGTAGVTQTTYVDEFMDILDATRDFRPKTGAAQKNTGTTDLVFALDDIARTPRPQGAAYDVGCWEQIEANSIVPILSQHYRERRA